MAGSINEDRSTLGQSRKLVTIECKAGPGKHTATILFFHGLGDSADGWTSGCKQLVQV